MYRTTQRVDLNFDVPLIFPNFPICHLSSAILRPEIILVRGLVKFAPAVAYHFCLNLPALFSQVATKYYFRAQ